jgi:erythromycin esterase
MVSKNIVDVLKKYSLLFDGYSYLDDLINQFKRKKVVLLGEASHGTSQFYLHRIEVTKKLIKKHHFSFIAVEGDWPNCYKINQYVKGINNSYQNAKEVLDEFTRWPTWIWANEEVLQFIQWLKAYNQDLPQEKKVGFYGLDVYSLWQSLEEIIKYLKKNEPQYLDTAIAAFRCFEPYQYDTIQYAQGISLVPKSCQKEVIQFLSQINKINQNNSSANSQEIFNLKQNVLVLKNSEEYYRTMIEGGVKSWNLRDNHMFDVFKNLMQFHGEKAKGIVWAHNTHIGDARATDMKEYGMINLGELIRNQWGENSFIVGFGTYKGTVITSNNWYGSILKKTIPPAKKDSWEDIFHQAHSQDQFITTSILRKINDSLVPYGHRAIGVVYHPKYEKGNYVPTILPMRYDSFIFIDNSNAITPLKPFEIEKEEPELFPLGL